MRMEKGLGELKRRPRFGPPEGVRPKEGVPGKIPGEITQVTQHKQGKEGGVGGGWRTRLRTEGRGGGEMEGTIKSNHDQIVWPCRWEKGGGSWRKDFFQICHKADS